MPRCNRPAYSFRDDPNVPDFDSAKALFCFDGVCVLCSGGARWLMRFDRRNRINFAAAQDELGRSLYCHYGVALDETYIVIIDGNGWTGSAGYLELCRMLGGVWRIFEIARIVPERWRDAAYRVVARNRYRWFGKTAHCALLSPEQRMRLL